VPTNSAKKAAQARQDWQLGGRLWRDVWDLVMADETITPFDQAITPLLASRKFGVGKTKVKQLVLVLGDDWSQGRSDLPDAAVTRSHAGSSWICRPPASTRIRRWRYRVK
jgi:hypothetical protein